MQYPKPVPQNRKKKVDNKKQTYYASADMFESGGTLPLPAELSAKYRIHGENGLIPSNDAV